MWDNNLYEEMGLRKLQRPLILVGQPNLASRHPNKNDCSRAAFRSNSQLLSAGFPQLTQTGNSGCVYATHQMLTSPHPSTRTTNIIPDEAENMVESKGSVNLIIWRVSETISKGSQREHFTDMHTLAIFTN